jgi:hypothetical protein
MDRGVSEMASMLALVGIAVVIVLAVGANVLFVESEDDVGPDASFSFDYVDEQQALVITHDGVEPVPARDLLIRGPQRDVPWSQVNDRVDNQTVVGPNTLIQIGRRNGYSEPVRPSDRISILYANTTAEGIDEPIPLSRWNGTDDF